MFNSSSVIGRLNVINRDLEELETDICHVFIFINYKQTKIKYWSLVKCLYSNIDTLTYCTCLWQMYEELYFTNLPPVIGVMLGNIAVCHRNLGQVDEAEKNYKK